MHVLEIVEFLTIQLKTIFTKFLNCHLSYLYLSISFTLLPYCAGTYIVIPTNCSAFFVLLVFKLKMRATIKKKPTQVNQSKPNYNSFINRIYLATRSFFFLFFFLILFHFPFLTIFLIWLLEN